MGFSRQEYWSGLPCPPPGDLPNPGIETVSFTSPALQVSSLPLTPPGKPEEPYCRGLNTALTLRGHESLKTVLISEGS